MTHFCSWLLSILLNTKDVFSASLTSWYFEFFLDSLDTGFSFPKDQILCKCQRVLCGVDHTPLLHHIQFYLAQLFNLIWLFHITNAGESINDKGRLEVVSNLTHCICTHTRVKICGTCAEIINQILYSALETVWNHALCIFFVLWPLFNLFKTTTLWLNNSYFYSHFVLNLVGGGEEEALQEYLETISVWSRPLNVSLHK